MLWAIAVVVVVMVVIGLLVQSGNPSNGFAEMTSMLLHHKYDGGRAGIELDAEMQNLMLRQNNTMRSYPISDIQHVEMKITTGGTIRAYGLGDVLYNNAQNQMNTQETDLFITTKDGMYPFWHLRLPENEISRWFEILKQLPSDSRMSA